MQNWMSSLTTMSSMAIYNHISGMTIRADTKQLFRQAYGFAYRELGRPARQEFAQFISKQTDDWFIQIHQSERRSIQDVEYTMLQRFQEFESRLSTAEKRQARYQEKVDQDRHVCTKQRFDVRDSLHDLEKKYGLLQSQIDTLTKERSQKSEQSKVTINVPDSLHSRQSVDFKNSNMHFLSKTNGNNKYEVERLNLQRPKRDKKANQQWLREGMRPIYQSQRSINIMDPAFRLLSESGNSNPTYKRNNNGQQENRVIFDRINQILWSECKDYKPTFLICSSSGLFRQSCISFDQGVLKTRTVWEISLRQPVLCTHFSDKRRFFFVGLESGNILAIQYGSKSIIHLKAAHKAPICGLYWIEQRDLLMSLGFDKCIKFWSEQTLFFEVELPFITTTCTFSYPWLIIGSCEETVAIISIKSFSDFHVVKPNQYKKVNADKMGLFSNSKLHGKSKTVVMNTIDGYNFTFNFVQGQEEGFFDIVNVNMLPSEKKQSERDQHFRQADSIDIGSINSKVMIAIGRSNDLLIYDTTNNSAKSLSQPNTQVGPLFVISFSPDCKFIAISVRSSCRKESSELAPTEIAKIIVMNLENLRLDNSSSE